jgi:hypothetical protein
VSHLLVDGDLEVPERRGAQSVHVEEEIVQVEPLRTVGGSWKMAGEGPVPLDRLHVMLVLRSVKGATGRADEGGIEPVHRIVPFVRRPRGGRTLGGHPSLPSA